MKFENDYENDGIKYIKNENLKSIKSDFVGNILRNGRFFDERSNQGHPIRDIISWKIGKNSRRNKNRNDNFSIESKIIDQFPSKDKNFICWLGHSSFIININNTTFLTDPCFYNILSIKRKIKMPCSVETINFIDYLLISHDHRDHLDIKSLENISKNNNILKALVPLNATRLFKNKILSNIKVEEAGWYQEYKMSNDIRVIFLPARHWGKRFLNDFNKTLWGSFLIIHKNFKLFFAGDTAYDSLLFKEINEIFGSIDVCLMPIGAYDPPSIMKTSHVNPEEAYLVFNDLEGKIFIPMHYGTYSLSDEYLGDPLDIIKNIFLLNKKQNNLKSIIPGDIFYLNELEV